MENFIKEGKRGFDFASVSSSSKVVNANRLLVHALAYNLFNWFRRLVLAAINWVNLGAIAADTKVLVYTSPTNDTESDPPMYYELEWFFNLGV